MRANIKKISIILVSILIVTVGLIGCNRGINSTNISVINNNTENQKEIPTKDEEDSLKYSKLNAMHRKTAKNAWKDLKFNDKPIPILMYHSVDYEKGNNLRIPKEKLREQMKYLKDNGFTTLTLEEVYDFMINNTPVPQKSVVLTFDDGYVDNYTNAFPILKEFGLKATVFVITSGVDNHRLTLTLEQCKEMDAYGIDIQPHTVNHEELDKLSYDKQLETLKQSKDFLDKGINKNCKFIAYPFGKYNDDTIKAAKAAGYALGLRMTGGWAQKQDGIYTLRRIYIGGDYSLETFKNKITSVYRN